MAKKCCGKIRMTRYCGECGADLYAQTGATLLSYLRTQHHAAQLDLQRKQKRAVSARDPWWPELVEKAELKVQRYAHWLAWVERGLKAGVE